MKLRVILAASAALMATNAMASDREFADIYTDCGLGALIAPRNDAVAAVTNVTWDSGTTAITSDASSPESCKGGKQAAAAFILEAYPSLEQDLARGDGRYLVTLLQIAGCGAQSQPALTSALRANFAPVAAEAGYTARDRYTHAERLYGILNATIATQQAGGSCTVG
jgi:hypothetical protein